jgi:hypothetical protein
VRSPEVRRFAALATGPLWRHGTLGCVLLRPTFGKLGLKGRALAERNRRVCFSRSTVWIIQWHVPSGARCPASGGRLGPGAVLLVLCLLDAIRRPLVGLWRFRYMKRFSIERALRLSRGFQGHPCVLPKARRVPMRRDMADPALSARLSLYAAFWASEVLGSCPVANFHVTCWFYYINSPSAPFRPLCSCIGFRVLLAYPEGTCAVLQLATSAQSTQSKGCVARRL